MVDVGAAAGRDRAEADGRERREDGRRAAVLAVRREVRERRRATALDGVLERLRRHPVDDDQDELLRQLVLRERAQARVALGTPAPQERSERGKHDRLEVTEHGNERESGERRARRLQRSATVPERAPPRRNAPTTTGAAPSSPSSAPAIAPQRSPHEPGSESAMSWPTPAPIPPVTAKRMIVALRPVRQNDAHEHADADADPDATPIQYHAPTLEP